MPDIGKQMGGLVGVHSSLVNILDLSGVLEVHRDYIGDIGGNLLFVD